MAVDGAADNYLEWANKFPGDIANVLKLLREEQGLPVDDERVKTNQALNSAIMTGVIMPVRVNGSTGTHEFVFAPQGGFKQEEKVVLDKARAILSCVRYGQNYSSAAAIAYWPENGRCLAVNLAGLVWSKHRDWHLIWPAVKRLLV